MTHDIFISYSTKDKPTADAICAALEANGIRCWIAPRDILPGSDWGEAIIDAIHACRIMVLVFSGNSNASPQIKREIERSVNAGIPVVPFRIEDVLPSKTLEYFISTQHWLDALTPPLEQHLQYLATTMRAMLVQKVDGSEVEVREPQLKPPPAATAVTPPPAATPPPVAAAAPVPPPAAPAAPAPAAGDSGRKFASPVVIGILVLAVAVVTLAGVLWKRGGPPTTPPVAVKAPEKPLSAHKAPAPAKPEDKAKAAVKPPTEAGQGLAILPPEPPPGPVIPEAKPEFPRKWQVEWKGGKSNALYTGSLSINNKIDDQTYTGVLLVKTPQGDSVSQNAIIYINNSKVKISCSNPSAKDYPADIFFLELSRNTMSGYIRDVKGNIGLGAIFTAVNR